MKEAPRITARGFFVGVDSRNERLKPVPVADCRFRSILTASRNGKEPERVSVEIAGRWRFRFAGGSEKDMEKPLQLPIPFGFGCRNPAFIVTSAGSPLFAVLWRCLPDGLML